MPEQDTLLSDVDTSIRDWYSYYLWLNGSVTCIGVLMIALPATIASNIAPSWNGPLALLATILGGILTSLNLTSSSGNFLMARNELQVARYRYDDDKDRSKLLDSYAKTKGVASFLPRPVSALPDKPAP